MLCSVDVAPRVRHVANIFTLFPLRSVGVWFSSTFPHKSAPSSFAYDSFKSDFHSCSPLVSSSNFGFFPPSYTVQSFPPKIPSPILTSCTQQTPNAETNLPTSTTSIANNPHKLNTYFAQLLPANAFRRKYPSSKSLYTPRNSSLPTLSASNNPPQNRFIRHAIPPPSPSASNNPNGVSLLVGQG